MPKLIAAGLPKPLGLSRDYDRIFTELRSADTVGFFPDFAFPEDFEPPCTPDDESFAALRRHGVKLLVPGHRLYPEDDFPSLEKDPLRRLIECAGRDQVMAITNYDEPAFANDLDDVKRLYDRVKEIDPSLPVYMVHPPIPRWHPGALAEGKSARPLGPEDTDVWIPIDTYLGRVLEYTQYCDVVGFDIYPVPEQLLDATTTPYRGGLAATDHRMIVGDYVRWLREETGKPYFIVLQGFTMERNDEVIEMYGLDREGWRAPTLGELLDMVQVSVEGGVESIVWWGSSLLEAEDIGVWENVLEASRKAASFSSRC